MNEIVSKIKNNYKTVLIIGGIILLCLLIGFLFGRNARENVPSNGEPINAIRTELNKAEGAKQDIANTASDISNTGSGIATTVENITSAIDTATGASAKFEQLINECTNIINTIRSQPAN